MNQETPIEITQVPDRLRSDFTGKIPEASRGTNEEREVNFLSRALAAFTLHKRSGCSLEDAAKGIVDGGGDGGIDAIYFSEATRILWVVQSKFHRSGQGEPDLGGVTKFKIGLENLLKGDFNAFNTNAHWQKIIPYLKAILGYGSIQVRALLVYSGIHTVSEDRRRVFEDLRTRFSADSDYFQWEACNLTTIHDWITGADRSPGVPEVEIQLFKPGWVREPYETLYGLLSLSALSSTLAFEEGK